VTSTRFLRTFVVACMLVLGAVAALTSASPAEAASACGKKVFVDWYDNGRIDRLYPLHCYEEAIELIPDDIRDYADAEDVITRALQAALRGNLTTGGADPTPGDDDSTAPGGKNPNGPSDPSDPSNPSDPSDPSDPDQQAAPDVDTSGPSSVPIPLLVLGGMSILLLAAGGLGYVSRRRQAARADNPDDFDTLA
jgi:hypothetical protein